MSEPSKVLLDPHSKPSLLEGLLLGRDDSALKSQKKNNSSSESDKARAFITEVPKSQVLGKIKDFLGVMVKANEKLDLNVQGNSRSDYDIEVLSGKEQEYIEMDLLLGVADLHTPEAVAAAEATMGSVQLSATSPSSSSYSDSEDDSDSGNDDITASRLLEKTDSEDWRSQEKPVGKPNKRPKIVVLD